MTDENIPVFNVRVYGILTESNRILVSDEIHKGVEITKFPGGGLHFGEGTGDCVVREFHEELSIKVNVIRHFYTVDFFQKSAFNPKQQVISIYYLVESDECNKIKTSIEKKFPDPSVSGYQEFRWVEYSSLSRDEFTFPIDKKVAELLIEEYQG